MNKLKLGDNIQQEAQLTIG